MPNTDQTNPLIFKELKQVMLNAQNETQIKKFVFENFEKFPPNFQRNLAASFLAEGLSELLKKEVQKYQENTKNLKDTYQAVQNVLEKEANQNPEANPAS